jgi:DNA-binding SARP family transcriptional activator
MLHISTLGTVNLTDPEGKPCAALLGQRKRLALFLYLTLSAPSGPTRRDTLLPLFWPESDDLQARRALRQVLHFLRHSLAPDIFVDGVGDGLLVDLSAVRCDAIAFDRALDAGDRAHAIDAYAGDLLPGLFVSDAPHFERWLETERARLRTRAADAAWWLARDAVAHRDAPAAERLAARAAAITPGDETALCHQLEILEQIGSLPAAVRAYDTFAADHQSDFGAPPSPTTRAVATRLRTRLTTLAAPLSLSSPSPSSPSPLSPSPLSPSPLSPSPLSASPSPEPSSRPASSAAPPAALPAAPRRPSRTLTGAALGAALAFAFVTAIGIHRSERDGRTVAATQAAHRLYEEGLDLASRSDDREAARFFHAALTEDSTFALAAYHAALSETIFDRWSAQRDFTRAQRLTTLASPHDALVIHQSYAAATNDRHAVTLADSLVRLYPGEADGELALGAALSFAGLFADAVPHLQRAITIDSSMHAASETPGATGNPCWACRAYEKLVFNYEDADSLDAAERAARAWTTTFPRDPWAWSALARVAEYQGHYAAALNYGQRGNTLAPVEDEGIRRARVDIRSGAFADADVILAERARDAPPFNRLEAIWWQIISLRTQGRLHDAMQLALAYPRESAWSVVANSADPGTPPMLAAAQVAYELGRYGESAAMFESILQQGLPEGSTTFYNAPGLIARHHTWIATHLVTALAADGDTTRVAALADSMQRWGSIEQYGRDQHAHWYARALILERRGDTTGAIDALRRSVVSTSEGYTRAEFEAARLLLARGRPAEAVAMLQPALRGNLEASNYYITRTELHELLARAFAALHAPDSAASHYQIVATNWQYGDPPFRARAAAARAFVVLANNTTPTRTTRVLRPEP